jgi:hypothetical protein
MARGAHIDDYLLAGPDIGLAHIFTAYGAFPGFFSNLCPWTLHQAMDKFCSDTACQRVQQQLQFTPVEPDAMANGAIVELDFIVLKCGCGHFANRAFHSDGNSL